MATNNLMNKITLYYSQMTKAEKKVADFVLSSPQEALASTITDLSKHCGVGECIPFLSHFGVKRLSRFQTFTGSKHFF